MDLKFNFILQLALLQYGLWNPDASGVTYLDYRYFHNYIVITLRGIVNGFVYDDFVRSFQSVTFQYLQILFLRFDPTLLDVFFALTNKFKNIYGIADSVLVVPVLHNIISSIIESLNLISIFHAESNTIRTAVFVNQPPGIRPVMQA